MEALDGVKGVRATLMGLGIGVLWGLVSFCMGLWVSSPFVHHSSEDCSGFRGPWDG
jgi:hypothetical protein